MNSLTAPVDLERIYPNDMDRNSLHDRDSIEIHEARYRFAADQLSGDTILDLACGCGFGTALMAARHPDKQFIGVDIDPEAIAYAQHHYQADNLQYRCSDAMNLMLEPVDCIVSLETIEHLYQPQQLIARLPGLLTANGRVIASVPITPTCDGNPHHLHDFSRRSFYRLLQRHGFVPEVSFQQRQPWVYDQAFADQTEAQKTSRSHGVGNNVLAYYRRHPWALVTRVISLLRHGPCNLYLTTVFSRTDASVAKPE